MYDGGGFPQEKDPVNKGYNPSSNCSFSSADFFTVLPKCSMEGIFFNISLTVPLCAIISWEALYTFPVYAVVQ